MTWRKNIWFNKEHEHVYLTGVLNPHIEVEFRNGHKTLFIHSVMTGHDKGIWLFCVNGVWNNADGYVNLVDAYKAVKASL